MPDFKKTITILTEADYQAAVAEFARLWDCPASDQDQRHMQQLLALIEAYEAARGDAA